MRTKKAAKKVAVKKVSKEILVPPTVHVSVSDTNPAPYNPRKIKPKKYEGIKLSIATFGFVDSIVLQKRSKKYGPMVLVGGHQRIKALKEICNERGVRIPDVPAVILDLTDRKAKVLNIALNNGGEYDGAKLAQVLSDIQAEKTIGPEEATTMGLEMNEVTKFLGYVEKPDVDVETDIPSFGRSVTLSLQFQDTRVRDALKKLLKEKVEVANKTTGHLVAEAFGIRAVV